MCHCKFCCCSVTPKVLLSTYWLCCWCLLIICEPGRINGRISSASLHHRSYQFPVHSILIPIMKVPLLGHIELYAFKSAQQIALTPRHNPLKPVGHFMYISVKHIESSTFAHTVYFSSTRISTQAAIISPHKNHSLVSITKKECVYCAVGAESLNIYLFKLILQILSLNCFTALFTQHAMRIAILSSVTSMALQYFQYYLIKGMIFEKKVTEPKMCVLIFFTNFVWNISHSKKNGARCYRKCILVFM
jgi:hypothetical protein